VFAMQGPCGRGCCADEAVGALLFTGKLLRTLRVICIIQALKLWLIITGL
jgi:hypothetical protein